ncbi:hypothetical protein SprV_0301257300 [Sparganum proliferum]|nr:unnamed protein product [Spirometra erinaceieuropaei]
MSIYDSPPNMPQLRYLYKNYALRGVKVAAITASLLTAVVTSYVYNKKVVSVRKFFESYDPDLEWDRLRKSGILKTVDKDGNPKNLFD